MEKFALDPGLIMIPDGDSTHAQMGPLAFLYMAVLTDLSYMQAVATEEEKNPKATALVCAAPYSRKSYIIAKYICYLLFCAACIAAYSIVALIIAFLQDPPAIIVPILLGVDIAILLLSMKITIRVFEKKEL